MNQLTQNESLKVLFNSESIESQIIEIKRERAVLSKQLLEVNFISKIYKSDANFLLIRVDDATKRYNQFLEKGIVIRNRSNQPLCDNCLRITIGTQLENKKLIKAFKELENE